MRNRVPTELNIRTIHKTHVSRRTCTTQERTPHRTLEIYLLLHDDIPQRISQRMVLAIELERRRCFRAAWQLRFRQLENSDLEGAEGW
jgi:hypothetical protein